MNSAYEAFLIFVCLAAIINIAAGICFFVLLGFLLPVLAKAQRWLDRELPDATQPVREADLPFPPPRAKSHAHQ